MWTRTRDSRITSARTDAIPDTGSALSWEEPKVSALHRTRTGLRCALVAVALCLTAAGCRINPVTGRNEFILFSTGQELAMGDSYHPNIVLMYDGEYQDPELKRYLGTIVMRLHKTSHRRDMRVDFTVVNTSMQNAFAIPGHVYATRGFLALLNDEAQFAAVMAHELGHVTALHTAKQMTRQVMLSGGVALAGGVAGDSLAARGVMTAGQLGLQLLELSYSREQELQADRVGAYYMALAGWDPREAVAMQQLLASLSEREAGALDKYLSTHPQSANRIQEINSLISEKNLLERGLVQGDGVYADRWSRRIAGLQKVHAAFGPYDEGMKHLIEKRYKEALQSAESAIGQRPDQAPFHRLKGDALLNLNRPGEAQAAYREALRIYPRYVPANMGLGQVALEQNELTEAERQFATAVHGFPANPAPYYGLGLARYRLNKYGEAIPPLETAASAMPDEPTVHYMLAVCYEQTGQPEKAYAAYRRALAAGLKGEAGRRAEEREGELGLRFAPPQ